LIDNLLVRILFTIVMIRWTGLAPWEFEFHFPGSLTSTFLCPQDSKAAAQAICSESRVIWEELARGRIDDITCLVLYL